MAVKRSAAKKPVDSDPDLGLLRTLATDLTNRKQFAAMAGITFDGKRDLFEALGYKRVLGIVDYRARYRRGGIAARVVDTFPDATWQKGAELFEDPDPDELTDFEEAWNDLADRLQVWSVFHRADILASIGRYSIVLIGAPGELDQPLPESLNGPDDVLYLTPYAEDDAVVDLLDEDDSSPRFGQPVFYSLRRAKANGARTKIGAPRVHWSRVLHVVAAPLDDLVYGLPALERVWNDLDDLDKIKGGGAEAFWRRVHQGYFFNIDPTVKVEAGEIDSMREKADEFAHGISRTMALRGTEVKALGSDVANISNPVDSILTLIAGATEIPKRILMGSERGELASSQDKTNFDERVATRRSNFAEPRVVRPFADLLIRLGALPEPEQFEVAWPETENDPDKAATVADKVAGLNAKAGGVVILPKEIRDLYLGLEPLSGADLAEVEEKEALTVEPEEPEVPEDEDEEPEDEGKRI